MSECSKMCGEADCDKKAVVWIMINDGSTLSFCGRHIKSKNFKYAIKEVGVPAGEIKDAN